MPLAERTARTVWQGDLMKGNGTVTFGTGAIADQQISFPTRTGSPDGRTSPEELIAGALSGCFAMAFSHGLHQKGHKSERIDVNAACELDRADGGLRITRIHLLVRGTVPGLDQAAFEQLAREQKCPVSNALAGNVDITIEAHLD